MRNRLAMLVCLLPAWACAQQSVNQSVTLYGVMDLAIASDSNSGKSSMRVDSGQQTASRLGVRGQEDLGGGLSASFMLESQIESDTGAPSFAGRVFGSQAWVGLSSPIGTVRAGRMFTPYFGAIATNDPFDAKGPGESTRVFYDSGVRMDNTVKYSLPPGLNGFYGDIAWAAGESAASSSANRQVSMDVGYKTGIFNIQLARHDANDATGATLARSTMIGGNIDLGPVRGWMAAARSTNDTTLNTRDLLVGVSVPFGLNLLSADYVRKTDRNNPNAGAKQIAAGYYHWLSKRTNLYLVSSRLRNGSAANYQTTLPGGTRRVIAAGIRHQF